MRSRIAIGLAVIVLAMTACSSGAAPDANPTSEPLTIFGTIGSSGPFIETLENGCMPTSGPLMDLREGQQVSIHDSDDKVVGILELGRPHLQAGGCVLQFTGDVPSGSGFYRAKVGDLTSDLVEEPGDSDDLLTITMIP